ncbi:MAG TPA: cytochrome c [Blastocatellia bacterium]|nr:cytochrome c [Blastocatellia bacterium]
MAVRSVKLTILIIFLAVSIYTVSGAERPGTLSAQDEDAKTTFKNRCARCHMADGTGKDYYTPDFTDPKWQATVKDEELINAITDGQNDMPAFGGTLSKDQIKGMVAYVRSLAKSNKQNK